MVACSHEIFDFQGDGTANCTSWMQFGVVVELEMAEIEHGHGESVAQGGQCRGGRGWSEIEGAGFAGDGHGDDEFRAFAEARVRLLSDGDDVDAEPFDGGDDGE